MVRLKPDTTLVRLQPDTTCGQKVEQARQSRARAIAAQPGEHFEEAGTLRAAGDPDSCRVYERTGLDAA